MLLLIASVTVGSAQSVSVEMDLKDLQEIDKRLENFETLKEIAAKQTVQIEELTNSVSILRDQRKLDQKEIELNDRVIAIKDQEIEAQKRAIADLRDISDRAIKLAETKKSSIWETYGPIAVIAIIVITIATVL